MRVRYAALAFLLCLIPTANSAANGANDAATIRDGATKRKAIVVPVPRNKAREWELAYLNEHFADRGIDFIGLTQRGKDGTAYDLYSFKISGRKREVYFVLP
jgi:hypothetical protein